MTAIQWPAVHLLNQSDRDFLVGPVMSSERQVAANRANARHSTGPRTLAGKSRSSRNAYQHGLSQPLPPDKATRAKVETFAFALSGDKASDEQRLVATEVAKAQLQLLRIRQRRADLLTTLDVSDLRKLRRLASLDRYERIALTKRRRADDEICDI